MAIHVLPHISRSKDNQAMKFDQFIEHNMRKIYQEKSHTNYRRETIFRLLSKIWNLAYLWTNSLKFIFIVCQVEGYPNIL